MGSVLALAHQVAALTGASPADPAALNSARDTIGRWHPDLDALFGACDGSNWKLVLPPLDALLPIERVVADWRVLVGIYSDLFDESVLRDVDASPAGDLTGVWSRRFVPITSSDGDCWAMDLREGPKRGGLLRWHHENGGFLYGDIAQMPLGTLLGQFGDYEPPSQ